MYVAKVLYFHALNDAIWSLKFNTSGDIGRELDVPIYFDPGPSISCLEYPLSLRLYKQIKSVGPRNGLDPFDLR